MSGVHPTAADVERFVIGAFEEIMFDNIRAHFSSCDRCARELQRQAAIDVALEEVALELDGAMKYIGGYAIESVLSRSPNGLTYVARDASGEKIALKELVLGETTDLDALKHFEREGHLLRQLRHPAIPRFVAAFTEDRSDGLRLYLGHELIEGESLASIAARGRTTEKEAKAIALQLLDVLSYLHTLSPPIYHRDIHPENVVRRTDGSIALVNFGAARDFASATSVSIVGKFGFVPVEQLAGVVDQTSDLWALGATLIHLLTLREPWSGDPKILLRNASVSPKFRAYLEKLTAARVEDRFQSATDAASALIELDRPSRRGKEAPSWLRVSALAAVLGLAVSTFFVIQAEHSLDAPIASEKRAVLHPCLSHALGDKSGLPCSPRDFIGLYRHRRQRRLAVFNPIFGSAQFLSSIVLPDHVTHATVVGKWIYVASPPSQIGILKVDPQTGAFSEQRWYDVPFTRSGLSSEIGGIAWDQRKNKVYIATRGEDPALYVDTWTGSGAINRIADLRDLQVRALAIGRGGESLYAINGDQLVELDFYGRRLSRAQLLVEPLEDVGLVVFDDQLALVGAFRWPYHASHHPYRRECVFIDGASGNLRGVTSCGPPGEAVFDQLEEAPKAGGSEVGILAISTRPPAEVWLDGKLIGDAPMTIQVIAGEHSIVLRAKGETATKEVTVRAGKRTTVHHLF